VKIKQEKENIIKNKLEEKTNVNLKEELNSRLFTLLNSENFEHFNHTSQGSLDKTYLKRNSQLTLKKPNNLNFPLEECFDLEPLKKHLSCLNIDENEGSKEEDDNLSEMSMRIPNPNSKRSIEEILKE
jgi:hypothetical protein